MTQSTIDSEVRRSVWLIAIKARNIKADMNEITDELMATIAQEANKARREALMKWDLTALTGTYEGNLMVAFINGGYTIKLPDCAIALDEKNKVITIAQLTAEKEKA